MAVSQWMEWRLTHVRAFLRVYFCLRPLLALSSFYGSAGLVPGGRAIEILTECTRNFANNSSV
jgi:hypothetical protein